MRSGEATAPSMLDWRGQCMPCRSSNCAHSALTSLTACAPTHDRPRGCSHLLWTHALRALRSCSQPGARKVADGRKFAASPARKSTAGGLNGATTSPLHHLIDHPHDRDLTKPRPHFRTTATPEHCCSASTHTSERQTEPSRQRPTLPLARISQRPGIQAIQDTPPKRRRASELGHFTITSLCRRSALALSSFLPSLSSILQAIYCPDSPTHPLCSDSSPSSDPCGYFPPRRSHVPGRRFHCSNDPLRPLAAVSRGIVPDTRLSHFPCSIPAYILTDSLHYSLAPSALVPTHTALRRCAQHAALPLYTLSLRSSPPPLPPNTTRPLHSLSPSHPPSANRTR